MNNDYQKQQSSNNQYLNRVSNHDRGLGKSNIHYDQSNQSDIDRFEKSDKRNIISVIGFIVVMMILVVLIFI